MSIPVMSGKEALNILLKLGFQIARQSGSHVQLVKNLADKSLRVSVPIHGNRDLPTFVTRSIIRQAGYTVQEFLKILGKR